MFDGGNDSDDSDSAPPVLMPELDMYQPQSDEDLMPPDQEGPVQPPQQFELSPDMPASSSTAPAAKVVPVAPAAKKKMVQAGPSRKRNSDSSRIKFSDWADTYEGCGLVRPKDRPSTSRGPNRPPVQYADDDPRNFLPYNFNMDGKKVIVGEYAYDVNNPRPFEPPVVARAEKEKRDRLMRERQERLAARKKRQLAKERARAEKERTNRASTSGAGAAQEDEPSYLFERRRIDPDEKPTSDNEMMVFKRAREIRIRRRADPISRFVCVVCKCYALRNATFPCKHMACMDCYSGKLSRCPVCTADITGVQHDLHVETLIYKKFVNPSLDAEIANAKEFSKMLDDIRNSNNKRKLFKDMFTAGAQQDALTDQQIIQRETNMNRLAMNNTLSTPNYTITVYDLSDAGVARMIIGDALLAVDVLEANEERRRQAIAARNPVKPKKKKQPVPPPDNTPPLKRTNHEHIQFSDQLKAKFSRLGQPVTLHPRTVEIPEVKYGKAFRIIVSKGPNGEKARIGHLMDFIQQHYAPFYDSTTHVLVINIHPLRFTLKAGNLDVLKPDGTTEPGYSGNNIAVAYCTEIDQNTFDFEAMWTLDAWRYHARLPADSVLEFAYSARLEELKPKPPGDPQTKPDA